MKVKNILFPQFDQKKKKNLASWQTFPKEKNTASPVPGKGWELMSNINQHTEFQSHDCQQRLEI
jgi:hypothetical protein